MAEELRETGISVVGDVPWGTHFCYFYETKQDLLDILIPYFKTGLENKEYCLWVISNSELLTMEEATSALRSALPDLDRYVADRSIEVVGHDDWFLREDTFDSHQVANQFRHRLNEALARGYAGMRVNGSPAWLRDAGPKELRRFEAELDKLFPHERTIASCTYPLATIAANEIFDVVRTHQFAIARRQGEWEVIETPELVQAKAEIKRLNEDLEQRVIERTNDLRVANEELRKEIAERKHAEALLHAKEQEFRAIVENAPDQIIRYDREFRRTYVNPAVARAYGLPAEALLGKPIGSVIQDAGVDVKEEDLAELRQRIKSVFDTGRSYEYETSWPMPTGRRYFGIRLFPELDLNDSVINVLEIARDITERKEVERAQTESQLRYETLVQSIDGIVWEADPKNFTFTFVSKHAQRILGYPLEQWFEGPNFWPDHMHPDDRDWAVNFCVDATARGEDHQFEYRMIAADGRVVWLNDIVSLHVAGDQSMLLRGLMVDITERKQAEDALRQSQDHLRLVIDTIPTMAWSLRPDGILDYLNQRWLDYTGLSFEEAIEEPTRTVHPEDLSRATEKWLVVKATSEAYEDEMRLQRADGEYRWFLVRIAPLLDEQGNLLKRYGVAIDIEERKRAEEKLKQSESQLAEAQRLAHIGSWEWDLRSNAVTWSEELYHIFGLQPGTISVAGEVDRFIHPDDLDLGWDTVKRAVASKEPYDYYHRILRPDGTERIARSRGSIMSDERGEPIKVFGATQDVTELKQAEEALREAEQKYRDIFENAGEGIFQSTPDGKYIAANPALARMYRFASPEELIDSRRDISQQVYVDPTRREEFKHQIGEQGAVRGFEHEVFRKDGSRFWISVNARAVRDQQGAIQYYEGTAQDINERKAAEEKLKATSEQLRALSASLQSAREEEGTRIGREIHDELGSTLTTLRWDLEGLDKALSEPHNPAQFQSLRGRVATMTSLIDTTINAVRRISSELRPRVLDDLGLVAAIKWQARQFEARTGIICRCECPLESLDLTEAKATALFRIFQEALTNVLRHSQATRVENTIAKETGEIVLTISDNGRGIRADEASGQLSLGLLGMRERVYLIGGEIDIVGVEGKGTTITVRVPTSEERL